MRNEHSPHENSISQPRLVREARFSSRQAIYSVGVAGLLSLAAALVLPWPGAHTPGHSEHTLAHEAPSLILELPGKQPLLAGMEPGCAEPAVPRLPEPHQPLGEPLVRDGSPKGPLKGVSVSRDHNGLIAVWSESAVAISRDGGKSFVPVAERLSGIAAVTVGQGGWFYIVRDRKRVMLGAVSPDNVISWHRTPFYGPTYALRTGAGALLWFGAASSDADGVAVDKLAISTNHGKSWSARDLYAGNFANDIQVDDDGHIQFMAGFEASCGGGHQERQISQIDQLLQSKDDQETWRSASWPLDVPVGWMLGANGWAYGVNDECGDDTRTGEPNGNGERVFLCAVGPDPDAEPAAAMKLPHDTADAAMAHNGEVSIAVIGSRVLRVDKARAEVLSKDAPPGMSSLAVDASENLLAIHQGYLVRWSAEDGWRSLFPSRAAVLVTARSTRQ